MDPNELLFEIRDAIENAKDEPEGDEFETVMRVFEDLDDHLKHGGELPTQWNRAKIVDVPPGPDSLRAHCVAKHDLKHHFRLTDAELASWHTRDHAAIHSHLVDDRTAGDSAGDRV